MTQNEKDFETQFENFNKTYLVFGKMTRFVKAGKIERPNANKPRRPALERDILRAGVVKQYELLMDMSWKAMYACLLKKGVEVGPHKFPVIQEAFKNKLIANEEDNKQWAYAAAMRNESVHDYGDKIPRDAVEYGTKYFYPLAGKLRRQLKKEL